ncbi:MAG: glycoside hydrolase family 5 protein [Bacteroidaceae bacterium]|nr:glycoside hydrolase family 5 protein [Bacteroidaceae bacterium]
MTTKRFPLLLFILIQSFCGIKAASSQKDYSHVRGVCHIGWMNDETTVRKELGYAKRLNLNNTRIWLPLDQYKKAPDSFVKKLKSYVRIAHEMGFGVMPILWNGNGLNPAILEEDYHEEADKYVTHIVNALKDEPGLFIWDIMNEPTCNDYHNQTPNEEERITRRKKIFDFVRRNCKLVRQLAPKNAITVGTTLSMNLEEASADLVDVLSFHDYSTTTAGMERSYEIAEKVAEKYKKPMLNSETGCMGRANPYDLAIQTCEKHGAGWYLFELMISGYWSDIHGIFYPDGTIRDPSIVAAIMGCFRNRDANTMIKERPNKEGYAQWAVRQVEEALKEETAMFNHRRASTDRILEAAEFCANLLESSQMIPMHDLPTAQIAAWRKQPANERDAQAIRRFTYDLAQKLKSYCQLF